MTKRKRNNCGKTQLKVPTKQKLGTISQSNTLEKASEVVVQIADAVERKSPGGHTVHPHGQRYNGVWKKRQHTHAGAKNKRLIHCNDYLRLSMNGSWISSQERRHQ